MAGPFTLGVEEEFQMVDARTGQLACRIHPVLEKGVPTLGHHIKGEMLQPVLEVISDICPDLAALRNELYRLRTAASELVASEGLRLISAGTHPSSHWRDQARTNNERYEELEEEYQDVGRSILIFAIHVHVGLERFEMAVPLMNQLRTFLPHLLALSSNSPFWIGRYTGLKSYRAVVWKRFPRSGVPVVFDSTAAFDEYVAALVRTGCIDNGKRIWWDIRPHPVFKTLEFRVCDMPSTIEDALALAALCQALVAKLTWMYKRNLVTPTLPSHFIDENKWRAMRYGLDAEFVDFVQERRLSMRDAVAELLDFVEDVVDDLGSQREIHYLRGLIEDPRGTGADRQIAVYEATSSVQAVTSFLMQQTLSYVQPDRVR